MDPGAGLDLFAVEEPFDLGLGGADGVDGVDERQGLVDVTVFHVAVFDGGRCCGEEGGLDDVLVGVVLN